MIGPRCFCTLHRATACSATGSAARPTVQRWGQRRSGRARSSLTKTFRRMSRPTGATCAARSRLKRRAALLAVAQPPTEESTVGRVLRGGHLRQVIGVFFGPRLLLSLMPCVLPMLPILSRLMVGLDGAPSRLRGPLLAGASSLGMALVYTGWAWVSWAWAWPGSPGLCLAPMTRYGPRLVGPGPIQRQVQRRVPRRVLRRVLRRVPRRVQYQKPARALRRSSNRSRPRRCWMPHCAMPVIGR